MTPYDLAKAEIGTVEWKQGSNPKVIAYYRDAGSPEVKDDATAWCAAFVGAMLARAGVRPTRSLLARSYLTFGTDVPLSEAREGDIVVFKRGGSTWQGHVGFFVRKSGAFIEVLGGNQADAVNVRRYPVASLLGVRRVPARRASVEKPRPQVKAPNPVHPNPVQGQPAAKSAAPAGGKDPSPISGAAVGLAILAILGILAISSGLLDGNLTNH